MTFCATIGRYDGKFLTFALHMRVLMDPLLEMSDYQHCQKTGKKYTPHKAWRGVDPSQLFPFVTEDRNGYAQLANVLTQFLPENVGRKVDAHDWFKRSLNLPYMEYEFFGFFEESNKHLKESMRDCIGMLAKIGRGEPLPDYLPLIKFLGYLESHGLAFHHMQQGGCF